MIEDIELLKEFNIKQCEVKLTRMYFSRIRMKCSIQSSDNREKLDCKIVQTNMNTFSIKLKRDRCEEVVGSNVLSPAKRKKCSTPAGTETSPIGTVNFCTIISFNTVSIRFFTNR